MPKVILTEYGLLRLHDPSYTLVIKYMCRSLLSFFPSYYGNGHTAVLPDCFDVDVLDTFLHLCQLTETLLQKYLPDAELWLGETSSFYGSGAPVLSSAYVAGFMYVACFDISIP